MSKMREEIAMWRRIFERLMLKYFDSKEKAKKAVMHIVEAAGGQRTPEDEFRDISDEDLLFILEKIRERRGGLKALD
jgi:uncharacterized protein YqeY